MKEKNNVSDLLVEINRCHEFAGGNAYTRDILSRCHREIRRLRSALDDLGERAGDQKAEIERLRADLKQVMTWHDELRARNAKAEAALLNVAEWYAVNGGRGAVHTDVFPIAAVRAALAKAEEQK